MENVLIESFREYLLGADKASLTVKGYISDLYCFIRWFEQTNGEEFSLQAVTPTDVREFRQFLLVVERRRPNTINRRLAALSALMKWARESGQIEQNPTDNVHAVTQTNPGPHYLDKKEQYALLRSIEKDLQLARLRFPKRWRTHQRDASLTILLLHTGLRLNEALSLQLDDLQLSDRKGQVTVRHGKGGKSRSVPLNTDARKALQEWLAVRPKNDGAHLWVGLENESAEALSGRTVERALLRLGQIAGVEHLTPHVLRHSFAKNLIDAGVGLEKVAALLGHANLNTTRIYVTPNQRDLELAVEQLTVN